MKKIAYFLFLGVMFTLLGCGSPTTAPQTPASTTAETNPTPITYLVGVEPKTNQDLSSLRKIGYQFNVPAQPAVISPDVAVKNAGLTSNADYTVEYQVLTLNFGAFSPEALEKNPVLDSKKGIDHLPVYIISSKSLIPVHSPSGAKPPETQDSSVPAGYRKGESNVVVDATSGVPLLTFSYR